MHSVLNYIRYQFKKKMILLFKIKIVFLIILIIFFCVCFWKIWHTHVQDLLQRSLFSTPKYLLQFLAVTLSMSSDLIGFVKNTGPFNKKIRVEKVCNLCKLRPKHRIYKCASFILRINILNKHNLYLIELDWIPVCFLKKWLVGFFLKNMHYF